ncbi:hypothetical protein [Teredinibacter purpureus]|uniref:hypothetical protein n=1 Tax=Teredinibacter purpureus TaxID=2731756 RepID=UPI0005F80427|nr:hypothetical protein [Teredinibacter purpureus]
MKYFLLLTLFVSQLTVAQSIDETLSGWGLSKYPIEKILALKANDLKSSSDDRVMWDRHILSKEDGKLKLRIEDSYRYNIESKIDDVLYSSQDKGEFGGELGATIDGVYKKLMDGNVRELIRYGNSLYVVEGLGHLGLSRGSVYLIEDVTEPKTPKRVTLLPEAPAAALLSENGNLIIAGDRGVYSISEGYFSSLNILYWDAFWSRIFLWGPTSIVEYEGKYLIGLPQGVAVLEASIYGQPKIALYMKKEFNK